ncbi:MAG: 50S ribosomal protein L19 [Parachlamydia sp.]|nr:MAG: 50S ribosomal protein L19 [Parachlamydia sp.]
MSHKRALIKKLEDQQIKNDIPVFRVGDTVRVHTRIIEGQKERIQIFTGTVISRNGGGLSETFTVHRIAYGEGMQRVFPLHSPRIAKIEVTKEGDVRRSKLYYLIGAQGKAAKVKGKLGNTRRVLRGANAAAPNQTPAESQGEQHQGEEQHPSQETASAAASEE